jgi:phage host-nuclease inhibitor protein Gam
MTDQDDRPDDGIQNPDQFEDELDELVDLSREIATVDLEISQRKSDADKDGARRTKSQRERRDKVEKRIWEYVDEHSELFNDGQEISYTGAVITRTPGTRNTILDMKQLVKALRDIGESSLVQIVENTTVTAIKSKNGVLDKLLKREPRVIKSERYWNFKLSFKPKETKSEKGALPKSIQHDLLRIDPLEPDSSA